MALMLCRFTSSPMRSLPRYHFFMNRRPLSDGSRTAQCDPDLLGFPERVGTDRAPRRVLIS